MHIANVTAAVAARPMGIGGKVVAVAAAVVGVVAVAAAAVAVDAAVVDVAADTGTQTRAHGQACIGMPTPAGSMSHQCFH